MFWVNMSSNEFGGEFFSGYDTPEDAAQAIARLALSVYETGGGIARSFLIVEADSKEEAEGKVATAE